MQFFHSSTTLKGGAGGRMEIEYLKKKKLNYVQVSQLFLSKIVGSSKADAVVLKNFELDLQN